MDNGSILYIPIQINGDGTSKPTELKDRELYVLDNGTLYVGRKNSRGTIEAVEIAGRVVEGADIKSPKLSGSIELGQGVVPKDMEGGRLFFVDDGQFESSSEISNETLLNALNNFITILESIRNTPDAGVVNTILEAEVE